MAAASARLDDGADWEDLLFAHWRVEWRRR